MIRNLLREEIPLHPNFILDQISKYREADSGLTVLHYAIRKALISLNSGFNFVKPLLEIGFPMYEANGNGESVLAELCLNGFGFVFPENADAIFEILIWDFRYDIQQPNSLPLGRTGNTGLDDLISAISKAHQNS